MHWALSLPMTAKPSHAEILLSVQTRRCFHSNPVKIFIAIAKQSLHLSLLNINIVKHSALLVTRSKSQTSCGCCCTEGPPPHCTEAALHSTTSVSPPRAKGTQNEGGAKSWLWVFLYRGLMNFLAFIWLKAICPHKKRAASTHMPEVFLIQHRVTLSFILKFRFLNIEFNNRF